MTETNRMSLREFHQSVGADFTALNGAEVVADYGEMLAEHKALREAAGVIDLSFRSRICLTGADRVRFLHGQITNDVKKLRTGEGCYAALVTAKGKMQSDMNIYCLQDELLLDFEPGLARTVTEWLEKYIVADDVQIVDVASMYGLLSVQGPKAEAVLRRVDLSGVPPSGGPDRVNSELPTKPLTFVQISDPTLGEVYLINHARFAGSAGILPAASSSDDAETRRQDAGAPRGFDLFVPTNSLGAVADKLIAAAKELGGRACGWTAFETARIESGIPRFGADMDETNIPLECGIEARAISYNKGCYIGQEVINRIHSIGHVNRELRGLRLDDKLSALPAHGEKLFNEGKEVGSITSAVFSPTLQSHIALGYVRREAGELGNKLALSNPSGKMVATIVPLPFVS